jgi:hypothetical protein
MNDRIKLVETFSYKISYLEITKLARLVGIKDWTELGTPMVPSYDGCEWEHYRQWNPRESADDDYAVLEWMRNKDARYIYDFKNALFDQRNEHLSYDYKIGDYARAALKVLTPPQDN